jgi:ATP-dependent DNA ligase
LRKILFLSAALELPCFRHACRMDLEGIVSKRIGSRCVSGRTRAWLKTKNPRFERR